jgi:hypothetical protein
MGEAKAFVRRVGLGNMIVYFVPDKKKIFVAYSLGIAVPPVYWVTDRLSV